MQGAARCGSSIPLNGLIAGSKAMAQIISVVGDTFADIICTPLEKLPSWGTDTLVSDPIRVMLGGSAANFAVHATNLNRSNTRYDVNGRGQTKNKEGRPQQQQASVDDDQTAPRQSCVLHSSVGGDQMGEFVRKQLSEANVEWSQQAKELKKQGTCVVLSGKGDRAFMTHRGSCAEFCREDIDVPRLLASSHVHIAGFYNCPALAKDLPRLLTEARANGATCSLGPQWDASEEWGGLDDVYPLLDVFMPNEDEALNISRRRDALDAARFFVDKGVGLVVVTRGGRGAFAVCGSSDPQIAGSRLGKTVGGGGGRGGESAELGRRVWEQRCSSVDVVDTTGAGDAFCAGFLTAWKATGGDVQVSLRWGCALGTAVVTRVGASPRLSVEEDIRPHLVV